MDIFPRTEKNVNFWTFISGFYKVGFTFTSKDQWKIDFLVSEKTLLPSSSRFEGWGWVVLFSFHYGYFKSILITFHGQLNI
jgi:hypothetical protein